MIFVIVIVLLIWLLWFLGPYIRRWAARRTANYVQEQLYRSMGLDPEMMRTQTGESRRTHGPGRTRRRSGTADSRSRRSGRASHPGKIIPREYGETVSFEVMQVTGNEKWLFDTDKSPVTYTYSNEIQITDVKYTIIQGS